MQCFSTNDSIAAMQKSLDALWLRQQVISDNIANQDTPGYKSKTVSFEELLLKTLSSPGESPFEERVLALKPKVKQDNSLSMGEDDNSVDADAENIALVRTQLQYQAMAQALSGEISRMSYVLNGGK